MTDPANARFGEPHPAREGHRLTRSEEEPAQQTGSGGPAHGGAEKFGLRWDSAEFGDSGSGESVFGTPPVASPTDVPSYSPDYLTGTAVPAPPAAPPLPVRDTSARTSIPPLATREPAQRSMFASPFDADYEQGAGQPQPHPTSADDESAPTSSFAVSAAETPPVDPRSGVLGAPTAPAETETPEKAGWATELDAESQDPEDTVRRIAESLGIDPGRQSRSRAVETEPAEPRPAEASPAEPAEPPRADSAESDASSAASVPAPPKLPMRLPTPAHGIARTEPAGTGTESAAAASTETRPEPTRRPIPRAARRARDKEQPAASTATSRLSADITATPAAEAPSEGQHGTAGTEPAAATTTASANDAETHRITAGTDESATGRAATTDADPAPSAATPPTRQSGDHARRSTTATAPSADGDHSTRAASVTDNARIAAEHTVAEANTTDTTTEEGETSSPAARLAHRHSNEPASSDHAETTGPAHSGAADGTDRADSADSQSWQNTDTLPAIRSRAESADATSRPFPTRNGVTVGLRSAPTSTLVEQSDTDVLRRRAAEAPAAEYVPTSRHRSPIDDTRVDDHAATESAETFGLSHDSVFDTAPDESPAGAVGTGGRRNRRATSDHHFGDTPTDIASRTGLPSTSRRAARRRAETTGEPPAIDVGLVMQLLLASHTLENVARNAEAGDVDLNGLITAAHRTRTAAVELVTTWFGGADQMREFAEALLAATEN
ncbi:hypothetical protein [Nocardia africana]|uniref:hypothetical protein n=1 Tax=Nocardia africana TaxID=134964 RepID=UPI0007A41D1D|nr:hypothetical protein [Nocardia africana]MCC3317402.1 hypothetical protein [Nocardia africana]